MTEVAETAYADEFESAVDQTIEACGGDMRAAVSALLVENADLEAQVSRLKLRVSSGYARGRPAR